MALWSKTDASESLPKDWNPANHPGASLVFVDQTEAANPSNRARGIKTPGWNIVREYLDSSGAPRYNVEPLVALSVSAADAGDGEGSDDAIVPNEPGFITIITITAQPTAQSSAEGAAEFTVTATAETMADVSLAYQWQKKKPGTSSYVAIPDATEDTLTLSELVAADDGYLYRCVVSCPGAKPVTSTGAKLTFVD